MSNHKPTKDRCTIQIIKSVRYMFYHLPWALLSVHQAGVTKATVPKCNLLLRKKQAENVTYVTIDLAKFGYKANKMGLSMKAPIQAAPLTSREVNLERATSQA